MQLVELLLLNWCLYMIKLHIIIYVYANYIFFEMCI